MNDPSARSPKSFCTEKARAALVEARRRSRDNHGLKPALEVFVTRLSGQTSYGWQIRQFGGVIIEEGRASFGTSEEAKAEGERALAARSAVSPS